MLTLICGIPNAGKTTYSKQFDNVIHLDDLNHGKLVLERIKDETGDVCVEGVYLISRQRRDLIKAYKGQGTKCIWLNTPVDECIARENRGRKEVLIRNSAMILEPPTYAEGWDEIEVIHG